MSMSFNDPIFWSFVLTMCSIALLTEVALLVHMLFIMRQRLWWYLLLVIPLAVSLWSFTVAWNVSNKFEYLILVPHTHLTTASYHILKEMVAQLINFCQLQTAITLVVFVIMVVVERIALPRTDPPVWTLVREHLYRG
jgi:hypothetical protein